MMSGAKEKRLVLILGGARSGKSRFAERMAAERGKRVLFVATATGDDEEMRERIDRHRRERPGSWRTLEEPVALASEIERAVEGADLVLIDCATLWVSNLLIAAGEAPDDGTSVVEEVAALIEAYRRGRATFLVIANEVGLGLVPPYPLGRQYRDALGRANQALAAAADEVYFLVAGIPLTIKGAS